MLHLVDLRWLAVGGQLATIGVVAGLMEARLPLAQMLALLATLAAFNFACWLRTRLARPIEDWELFAGLLVDVGALTGQLYFSGGIHNPFVFLYVLQVTLGSVLLGPRQAWGIFLLTTAGFAALAVWHEPLVIPGSEEARFSTLYVAGLLVCFVLDAALIVIFIERIGHSLRQRDASLAEMRQRAAEEEQIVRMGLLASGAAHELGTPLATLSVILGDWARMAPFAGEPELRDEIEEMQRQIQRCKQILSSILASAGESRAEALDPSMLRDYVRDVARQWCASRADAALDLRMDELPDVRIVADTAVRQMIDNVLDNATEAAPGRTVVLEAAAPDDELVLAVRDEGPGFAPDLIAQMGAPYVSTKGAPGRGLGLFLAVNVARSLGGRVRAHNLASGAEVVITIPLSSLSVEGHASR